MLMWAIYSGQTTIRNFLLVQISNQGVPLDLFEASAVGDTGEIEAALDSSLSPEPAQLIQLTPDSRIQNYSPDGWTALHLAAAFGTPEAVKLLLERGAKVDAVSKNRRPTSRSTPPLR